MTRAFSLRTVLIATLVLPLATATVFGGSWARDRRAEAQQAEKVGRQIEMLSVLSQLQFGIETNRLYRGLDASMLPTGVTTNTVSDAAPKSKLLWDNGQRLVDSPKDLDALTGGDGAEILQKVIDRHSAAVADPDLPTLDDDLTRSAADLRRIIAQVRDRADREAVRRTAVFDQFSELQALMLVEARTFIAALGQADPSPATVLEIYRTGAREDAIIEQMRSRLTPALERQLIDGLAGVEMEALRDGIAVQAGIAVGPSFVEALTPERLQRIQARYYTLPEVRGELAEIVTAEATTASERAEQWFRSAVLVAAALALLTVLVAVAISRLVIRRLVLLSEAASRIGDGDIDKDPLPPGGPREIAEVSIAFNRMSELLLTLDHQVSAIGAARLDDPWLDRALPGRIGSELQQSVRLIASTNERLRAAEAMASSIVDAAVDAIVTVDAARCIVSANPSAETLAGSSDLDGRRLADVFPGLPSIDRLVDHGETVAVTLDRPERGAVPTLVSARRMHDEGPDVAVFIRDVSEQAAWEERFRHQATHDELTDLPNRFAFDEHLEELVADAEDRRPVAVLATDIDRFRYVNEAHGIHNGDRVICLIGERIATAVGDGFVVRIGGDEFAVVVRGIDAPSGLLALAERVRDALGEPIDINGELLTLQTCVGVSVVPDSTDGTVDLLRYADVALSVAKDAGPGSIRLYDQGMSDQVERRTRLEQGLRTALATDQLEMFAQPIVDLATEHLTGVELLARWRQEGEWIPPDVFIPIAEESGLIQALGRWALGAACKLLTEFEAAGHDQTVSVNISGLHLMGGKVAAELAALLEGTTFERSRLRVELTESFLLDDPEVATERLDEIRALGAQIVIDDFGTGYSSLTYLHALPIDGLKLDRSFVDRLGTGDDETIVRLVNDLAEGLHLDLVAEGVETSEQRATLIEHGYRKGQGYLWSRPVPIRELWPMLHEDRTPLPTV